MSRKARGRWAPGGVACAALLGLLASGCAPVGENYKRPVVALPDTYGREVTTAQGRSYGDVPWAEQFDDPALVALINAAIDNNLDLRLAVARLQEFQARAASQKANTLPTVGVQTGVSPRVSTSPDDNAFRNAYSQGVVFNWEIDFFGRLRRGAEAAVYDLQGTEEEARAVMASLVAAIARNWFELRMLDEQIAVTQRNITLQADALALVRERLAQGVSSGLHEAQAVSQLANTRSQVPLLEQQVQIRENLIRVLLGRGPGPIDRPAGAAPPVPAEIPVGLPSALLERRADIRAAERALAAATARVGAAQANAIPFPRVGLTAFAGTLSTALENVFGGDDAGVIALGPFVDLPLFDGGRRKAGVAVAVAQANQAGLAWRSTILLAMRETADALVSLQKIRARIEQQAIQVEAARKVVDLTDQRYRSGVADYLEVLDSQRVRFGAEISLATSQQQLLVAYVDLYRALGGGWSDAEVSRVTARGAMADLP
jgi:multidrug efflux system outer membrane protein